MTDKRKLCEEIGNFFGTFSAMGESLCIDNGDKVYRYSGEDELLADWLDTLIEHQNDGEGDSSCNWEEAIKYIYFEVLHSHPRSVYPVRSKTTGKLRWKSAGYGPDGGKQQYHLGTYLSVVDAISAQKKFTEYKKTHTESECQEKAEQLKAYAKAAVRAGKTCVTCGRALKD